MNSLPYSQRPEWKDIIPIPQEDGPNSICKIAYSPNFEETMNYFRAILEKDEKSLRAFDLTTDVILLNPANYTAWYFRKILLKELNLDLKKELEFLSTIGIENPKNYQIWYHRKFVVELLNDYSNELKYTEEHILAENKNYHAWSYRQWVIEKNQLWNNELEFIDLLIKEDFRNNSAWNQRYFIITQNYTQPLTKETIEKEMEYCFYYIKKSPNNLSPWVYLKGLFLNENFNNYPSLKKWCLEFKEMYVTCPHVLDLLIDIYEAENTKSSIQEALNLCSILENKLDTLHCKYWNFKKNNLQQKITLL